MKAISSALGSGDALNDKINNELVKQGLEKSTSMTNPTKATEISSAAIMQTPVWALAMLAAAAVMAF